MTTVPSVVHPLEGHVAARAEADRVHVRADVAVEQRLAGREHGRRARREAGDELGLGRGDRLERAEQLEVHRPDADDHADVRLGDRGQLGDLPGAAHPHLQDERLGAGRSAEHDERQADLGVVVERTDDGAHLRAEHRADDVLRRRLAGRAGDRDHPGAERAAPGASEPVQREERVRVGEADPVAARPLGVLGRDEHAPGAGVERLLRERAAVVARSRAARRTGRPDRTARESMTARDGPAAARVSPTSRAPAAAARSSELQSLIRRTAPGTRRRRRGAGAAAPRARR